MENIDIGQEEIRALSLSLRKVSFFDDLSVADLDQVLDRVRLYAHEAGSFIFKQGDKGDAFYIVHEGELDVLVKKGFFSSAKKVGTLKSGNFFGEMALLDSRARNASVRCVTRSKVFVLLNSDFDHIKNTNPSFERSMKKLSSQRKFETRHTT